MNSLDLWIDRIYRRMGVGLEAPRLSLSTLQESEWNKEFERLMRNRLLMGAFRYGVLKDKEDGKKRFNYTQDAIRRLKLYNESPNLEILIDVANMMLLAFTQDRKIVPFIAIDDGEHTQEEK